ADTDFGKEAADMGCDHQQMIPSAPETLGKIDNIMAHSSTATDETLFFQLKK
ncbi:hypothetical protein AVEN_228824-1, partial [Araneus ventricosus]